MACRTTGPLVRIHTLTGSSGLTGLRALSLRCGKTSNELRARPTATAAAHVRHHRRFPRRRRRRVGADQGRGTRLRRAPVHPRAPVWQEHAARLQDPRRGRRPPRHRRAQRSLALPGDGGVKEEGGVHLLPGAPLHLLLLLL